MQNSLRAPKNSGMNDYKNCKTEVYAESNAKRVIELGSGWKQNKNSSHSTSTSTKGRQSNQYAHLQQTMTPPQKVTNGQLYSLPSSAGRPTKTHSSRTVDTRESDEDMFLRRGPDPRVYPSMMK